MEWRLIRWVPGTTTLVFGYGEIPVRSDFPDGGPIPCERSRRPQGFVGPPIESDSRGIRSVKTVPASVDESTWIP